MDADRESGGWFSALSTKGAVAPGPVASLAPSVAAEAIPEAVLAAGRAALQGWLASGASDLNAAATAIYGAMSEAWDETDPCRRSCCDFDLEHSEFDAGFEQGAESARHSEAD